MRMDRMYFRAALGGDRHRPASCIVSRLSGGGENPSGRIEMIEIQKEAREMLESLARGADGSTMALRIFIAGAG